MDQYKARVTYTIVNTGGHPVTVSTAGILANTLAVSGFDYNTVGANEFTIQSDGRLTIAGDIVSTNFFNAQYGIDVKANSGDAKVQVSATAVVARKSC